MKQKKFSLLMPARFLALGLMFTAGIYNIKMTHSKDVILFCILFVVLIANTTLRVRKFKNQSIWFLISILLDILLILLMQNVGVTIIYAITVVDLYLFRNFKTAVWMTVPILGSLLYTMYQMRSYSGFDDFITSFMANALALFFFAGASRMIQVEQKLRAEMQVLNSELKQSQEHLEKANLKIKEYADTIEEVAILGERNRIAGEFHDTIGHKLTGLIMEIDLCEKLMIKNTEQCQVELKKASTLARETLAEVRKSVKAIKPEEAERFNGVKALEVLLHEFEANTKIKVVSAFSKQQYRLSPTIGVTLYRVIQEALTNCAKHSQATEVIVQLNFRESGIDLYIKDNGIGKQGQVSGLGLANMQERITALGGTVVFESFLNGFSIKVQIPVESELWTI